MQIRSGTPFRLGRRLRVGPGSGKCTGCSGFTPMPSQPTQVSVRSRLGTQKAQSNAVEKIAPPSPTYAPPGGRHRWAWSTRQPPPCTLARRQIPPSQRDPRVPLWGSYPTWRVGFPVAMALPCWGMAFSFATSSSHRHTRHPYPPASSTGTHNSDLVVPLFPISLFGRVSDKLHTCSKRERVCVCGCAWKR